MISKAERNTLKVDFEKQKRKNEGTFWFINSPLAVFIDYIP